MNVSRRSFLGGFASFCGLEAFAATPGLFSADRPLMSFGAISDIHIRHPKSTIKNRTWIFEHALEWYRKQGVDAVVIAGDLANKGLTEELEMVGAAWRKVFPENKGADGRKVEKVFITGNHDHDACGYGAEVRELYPDPKDFEAHKLANDYSTHWLSAFDEPYAPIYMKEIGGYRFVGSHWDDGGIHQFGLRLKEFLGEHRDELKGERPFFYIQHPHPRGTVYGDLAAGSDDDGVVTQLLSEFPNAIAFSGHSHWTITDERAIWQGAFTSVNLGCLCQTGFCRTRNALAGYENWRTPGWRKATPEVRVLEESKVMPNYPSAFKCYQGSLVKVYADRVVIGRHEFSSGIPVADDWVIPLPTATEKPFSYRTRSENAVPPEFPADAEIKVELIGAKNRAKAEKPSVRLAFPAANAVRGTRVYDYLIEILSAGGAKTVRSVLAQGCELALSSDAAQGPSTCVLARETLPKGTLTFRVYPCECFGKVGRPLVKVVEL